MEEIAVAKRRTRTAAATRSQGKLPVGRLVQLCANGWSCIERNGQLKRIDAEVDPDEELSAITYMATRREDAPALLFENVKGDRANSTVLANMLGASKERYALAVGLDPSLDTSQMIEASRRILRREVNPSRWRNRRPRSTRWCCGRASST